MKRRSKGNGDLFIEGSGQLRLVDKSVEQQALEKGNVECLGMTFDSEDERRAYFTDRLREKLADPEFRKTPGFPKGTDEDIVRMSDAPWYTACPNPFLADFVRVYGKPYDPKERYERDPLAVDTSVGKTDALYKAHGYHTKVPHLAIVPSILHYTEPGDILLDGFAGSGMTGVAAQWCGSAPAEYRKQLEAEWSKQGLPKPKWGARRAILNDLGPAATFISASYNLPFSRLLKKSPTAGFEGGFVAEVEGDFAGDGSVIVEFGGAAAGGLVHLVMAGPSEEDGGWCIFAVEAAGDGSEDELARALRVECDVGGLDQIGEVAVPQLHLDDPPLADQRMGREVAHPDASASSLGRRTRLYAAAAKVKAHPTRPTPLKRVFS